MIFGYLVSLKLPDICLIGQENPRKNFTQENCPYRGSNQGPLRDARMLHNGGQLFMYTKNICNLNQRFSVF